MVEHMREMAEYLLVWNTRVTAARRNARAALVNMTSAQATRDALKAEVPVPDIFLAGHIERGGVATGARAPLAAKLARLGPGSSCPRGRDGLRQRKRAPRKGVR